MIEKNQSYNFFAGFGTFSIRGICLSFFFVAADLLEMLFPSASKFLAFFRQNFRIPPRGTSCAGSTEEVPSPRCPCFVQSTQGRASVRPRARRSTGSGFCLSTDKQVLADDVGSWLSRPDIFIQDSCLSIIPNHSKTSATNWGADVSSRPPGRLIFLHKNGLQTIRNHSQCSITKLDGDVSPRLPRRPIFIHGNCL